MKSELIELVNSKYNKCKSFQDSKRTDYNVFPKDLEKATLIIEELKPFLVDESITTINMSVRYEIDDYKIQILFSVPFGYEKIN